MKSMISVFSLLLSILLFPVAQIQSYAVSATSWDIDVFGKPKKILIIGDRHSKDKPDRDKEQLEVLLKAFKQWEQRDSKTMCLHESRPHEKSRNLKRIYENSIKGLPVVLIRHLCLHAMVMQVHGNVEHIHADMRTKPLVQFIFGVHQPLFNFKVWQDFYSVLQNAMFTNASEGNAHSESKKICSLKDFLEEFENLETFWSKAATFDKNYLTLHMFKNRQNEAFPIVDAMNKGIAQCQRWINELLPQIYNNNSTLTSQHEVGSMFEDELEKLQKPTNVISLLAGCSHLSMQDNLTTLLWKYACTKKSFLAMTRLADNFFDSIGDYMSLCLFILTFQQLQDNDFVMVFTGDYHARYVNACIEKIFGKSCSMQKELGSGSDRGVALTAEQLQQAVDRF